MKVDLPAGGEILVDPLPKGPPQDDIGESQVELLPQLEQLRLQDPVQLLSDAVESGAGVLDLICRIMGKPHRDSFELLSSVNQRAESGSQALERGLAPRPGSRALGP